MFEDTANQEVEHAFGHLDLLYPASQLTPAKALQMAIEGETYEYTEMYPNFRHLAEREGNAAAAKELDEQIAESKNHAACFQQTLAKAVKRFAALAKVEEIEELIRPVNYYRTKAKRIHDICAILLTHYKGRTPDTIAELVTKKLRPGDVYAHTYSGLRGELTADGHTNPGMVEGRRRGVAMLEAADLGQAANEKIRNLSKGMAQLVQLLGSMVHRPDLLAGFDRVVGLRAGRLVPMRTCATCPSTRNRVKSSRRAPTCWRPRRAHNCSSR